MSGFVDTAIMIMWMVAGRHPGEPSRPWLEAPAIRHGQVSIWRNPGAVPQLDFHYGVGGRELEPRPPFKFLKEDPSGTTSKVFVRDARGREWQVRFGDKAGADVFSSRLAWSVGYYVEPNYYVASGRIIGAHNLRRARHDIDVEGGFSNARFQLRSKYPEFVSGVSWSWDNNPFLGTPQLAGLKIMMMLVSDWDNKDQRQASTLGSNTAIFREGDRYLFFVDDWGRSLGKWGGRLRRTTWNPAEFYRQTPKFITGVKDNQVQFSFKGQNSKSMRQGITVADVRWLMQYLGRVTDAQLREGLVTTGADARETVLFAQALRTRIEQLRVAAGESPRAHAAAQGRSAR